MPTIIRTEQPIDVIAHVYHGEDWIEAIPQIINPASGQPFDITDTQFELTVRPSFNHTTLFAVLSSEGGGPEILREDPTRGLALIYYPMARVEENLPLNIDKGWKLFMRLKWFDVGLDTVVNKMWWVGTMYVHPARHV